MQCFCQPNKQQCGAPAEFIVRDRHGTWIDKSCARHLSKLLQNQPQSALVVEKYESLPSMNEYTDPNIRMSKRLRRTLKRRENRKGSS